MVYMTQLLAPDSAAAISPVSPDPKAPIGEGNNMKEDRQMGPEMSTTLYAIGVNNECPIGLIRCFEPFPGLVRRHSCARGDITRDIIN